MPPAFYSWLFLVSGLCFATFGLSFCLVAFLSSLFFFLGVVVQMYLRQKAGYEEYVKHERFAFQSYVYEAVEKMKKDKQELKHDKRLTGSYVIDEQLQDIISFIIRDYVYPWYDQLSDNEEVPHEIRVAVQNVIVAFANRMKEADWIPFLTTQIVDDAASHLRLYRQARSRLKSLPANSKMTLEDAFFDLELAMENNTVCRDHVCNNPSLQRCYLEQLTDIVLFYLSPEVEFHCLALRYITRELIVNSVLIPLINKLSDPDYINQMIIWLCKDLTITSEVFLTVLKVADNVDELLATKDVLNKEIATLVSNRFDSAHGDSIISRFLDYLQFFD
ncbi:sorting nexin-13-like [Cimex lectularius]|uniref:PXA domain-containing protein n=1 Tax=Cimex lectularius TaxID=79782 RepID=A0A8I6S5T0_CIMLE|nr:sorting nexin-13-like [Cimex lectularius]